MQRTLNELQKRAMPEVLEAVLADDDEQIAFKRKYVEQGEAKLVALAASRTAAETRYKGIKGGEERRLAERLGAVKAAFSRIALHLLAETCTLREAKDTRRIGQEGEMIDFPILEVMMSSGVFTGNPSARADSTSVSESQREFIDLAFRMALMEAAADNQSDAMLVLETPEASLDSLFVTEAGALFRGFATGGGSSGNVFIASTNLNNEGMIPALFGAVQPPPRETVAASDADALTTERREDAAPLAPAVPPELRERHLINLLRLSAPNAALRQHRAYYEEKLRNAVFADQAAVPEAEPGADREAQPGEEGEAEAP
jgi:hypothetical protein